MPGTLQWYAKGGIVVVAVSGIIENALSVKNL